MDTFMEVAGTHLTKLIVKYTQFALRHTGSGDAAVSCSSLELRAWRLNLDWGANVPFIYAEEDKTVKSIH